MLILNRFFFALLCLFSFSTPLIASDPEELRDTNTRVNTQTQTPQIEKRVLQFFAYLAPDAYQETLETQGMTCENFLDVFKDSRPKLAPLESWVCKIFSKEGRQIAASLAESDLRIFLTGTVFSAQNLIEWTLDPESQNRDGCLKIIFYNGARGYENFGKRLVPEIIPFMSRGKRGEDRINSIIYLLQSSSQPLATKARGVLTEFFMKKGVEFSWFGYFLETLKQYQPEAFPSIISTLYQNFDAHKSYTGLHFLWGKLIELDQQNLVRNQIKTFFKVDEDALRPIPNSDTRDFINLFLYQALNSADKIIAKRAMEFSTGFVRDTQIKEVPFLPYIDLAIIKLINLKVLNDPKKSDHEKYKAIKTLLDDTTLDEETRQHLAKVQFSSGEHYLANYIQLSLCALDRHQSSFKIHSARTTLLNLTKSIPGIQLPASIEKLMNNVYSHLHSSPKGCLQIRRHAFSHPTLSLDHSMVFTFERSFSTLPASYTACFAFDSSSGWALWGYPLQTTKESTSDKYFERTKYLGECDGVVWAAAGKSFVALERTMGSEIKQFTLPADLDALKYMPQKGGVLDILLGKRGTYELCSDPSAVYRYATHSDVPLSKILISQPERGGKEYRYNQNWLAYLSYPRKEITVYSLSDKSHKPYSISIKSSEKFSTQYAFNVQDNFLTFAKSTGMKQNDLIMFDMHTKKEMWSLPLEDQVTQISWQPLLRPQILVSSKTKLFLIDHTETKASIAGTISLTTGRSSLKTIKDILFNTLKKNILYGICSLTGDLYQLSIKDQQQTSLYKLEHAPELMGVNTKGDIILNN